MKKLCFLSLLITQFALAFNHSSSEKIKFTSIKDNPQISVMKTHDFAGTIERIEEENPDLRMVDYYEFPHYKKSKLTQKNCETLLARIFGPPKEITLQVKIEKYSNKIIKSDPVCEAVALDPDPDSKIPERRILMSVKKGTPFALVFKLSKKSDSAVLENTREFLKNLK